jgi:hypothetical protein
MEIFAFMAAHPSLLAGLLLSLIIKAKTVYFMTRAEQDSESMPAWAPAGEMTTASITRVH